MAIRRSWDCVLCGFCEIYSVSLRSVDVYVWMCHGLRKLGNSVSKVEFRERGKPASWGSLVWSNLDVTLFSLELR